MIQERIILVPGSKRVSKEQGAGSVEVIGLGGTGALHGCSSTQSVPTGITYVLVCTCTFELAYVRYKR
jgi:hypothetical protein